MHTLVPVDGSFCAVEAAKYAARHSPRGRLLLLYVAPSGRHVDLERGRFVLESSRRQCEIEAREVRVETRLEVGDPREKIHAAAADRDCERVIMGAHGVNDMPRVDRASLGASSVTAELHRPVVLVTPTGRGLVAAAHGWDEDD